MRKYGLTEERYNQLLTLYGNEEEVAEKVKDWGVTACNNGYDIFDLDGTGILEINKIDELCVFESDEEAVKQAAKDGVKLIPIEELPEKFERKYAGYIDTPENRETIAEFGKSIKAGIYKVEIEFTLEEDTLQTTLDNMFENAMYNFNNTANTDIRISSTAIGRYIPVTRK